MESNSEETDQSRSSVFIRYNPDNRLFLSFSGIVTSAKKHGSIFHLIPKKTKVHKLLYPDSSEEIIVPRQHCDHLEGIDGYIQSNTLTLLLGVTGSGNSSLLQVLSGTKPIVSGTTKLNGYIVQPFTLQ